jgi:hypothetical protein
MEGNSKVIWIDNALYVFMVTGGSQKGIYSLQK